MATSNAKTKSWARGVRGKPARRPTLTPAAQRCRRKFLRFFPDGYHDETYIDWERGYKWSARERWVKELAAKAYGFDVQYRSRPSWNTYRSLIKFAEQVRRWATGEGHHSRACMWRTQATASRSGA